MKKLSENNCTQTFNELVQNFEKIFQKHPAHQKSKQQLFVTFLNNDLRICKKNKDGDGSAKHGHGPFSMHSPEEFRALQTMQSGGRGRVGGKKKSHKPGPYGAVPPPDGLNNNNYYLNYDESNGFDFFKNFNFVFCFFNDFGCNLFLTRKSASSGFV